ncbi:YggS family pyridoxal phosphate-dependent enzyme [Acinetobacter sp. A3.8]|uniref:Pyridoxal phosphate homeostasis protein n=1 Tax=Acinetobacter sedimenti TaxID=2919922 RepID=A0A9X1WZP9_9GAMM|nr:YggS family pyridoxal phosphate-dependent enzyme [Acinetobacter sedimenti]MCJ8147418.1 YggS family pyridoxal phosphate-dependent enzyme [Acinetobacter sedimenti]
MTSLDLATNLIQVQRQIEQASLQAKRNAQDIQFLAVSKTHPAQSIAELYQLGQKAFGENYLQEALEKIEQLKDLEIEWHFIGHVQRNKTKHLAEKFAWVHGVDRLIIAERLSNQRPQNLQPLNICLQVNIDDQESKDGCRLDEVAELVEKISRLPNLKLRGLMVIPKPEHLQAFTTTKQLFDEVKQYHAQPEQWDTLSMGMSADMADAIQAGSTMVRIGTALFGARVYSNQ